MKSLILMLSLAFAIQSTPADKVSFTLLNKTAKSIALKIPGVMNPNLSPFSDSGVTLKIGQEIFFRLEGKKTLLLVVSKELEGQRLEVSKLIKERTKAIKVAKKNKKKKN